MIIVNTQPILSCLFLPTSILYLFPKPEYFEANPSYHIISFVNASANMFCGYNCEKASFYFWQDTGTQVMASIEEIAHQIIEQQMGEVCLIYCSLTA